MNRTKHLVVIGVSTAYAIVFRGRRPPSAAEAPGAVAVCAVVSVAWGWTAPSAPALAIAGLAVETVYAAWMLPSRFAKIAVVVEAVGATAAHFLASTSGRPVLDAVGVVATNVGLGPALLAIRITTEKRIGEHMLALAEANTRLDELTRTDTLTGLANRRQLDETVRQAFSDARRTDRPISVIMIDIDHFKRYNDHYGHLRGDDCLKAVAIRDTDVAARYGGEGFSVVLPATGPPGRARRRGADPLAGGRHPRGAREGAGRLRERQRRLGLSVPRHRRHRCPADRPGGPQPVRG